MHKSETLVFRNIIVRVNDIQYYNDDNLEIRYLLVKQVSNIFFLICFLELK